MFASFGLDAVLQASTDDGLTLSEVVADLPTDPASIFAILLLVGSLAFVLWAGGRPRGKGGSAA